MAAREDKLRKQNEQLEQELIDKVACLEGLHLTHQELEESNEREISALNSLLQENEERWEKHHDVEREKFRNTLKCFETLKQEHTRLKEIWTELEMMLLARVETLEAQWAAKETECFLLISCVQALYQAGFDVMGRKVDQLKAQRDQLMNSLL
ncbi:hypothetical protein FIBSPDRAFT_987465 [Athelia psychrophila]|uniref:Uncharacterized protein n=1 Tax=Athelia psychrophila TaxID=1759441 RepID=A0A166AK58_9AGAM|nr:hypothetical protein FIBSPDRAFT_987465 [Fibularhizoctonia sp. CBS 109695]